MLNIDIGSIIDPSFIGGDSDASKSRNGSVDPMIEVLLYAKINCSDAAGIVERIKRHEEMTEIVKEELVVTLKEATPHCPWDAND